MKERPMLFSAAMVRAILRGRKNQTRRVVKPQPIQRMGVWGGPYLASADGKQQNCPYGVPGNRLWVKERWRWVDMDGGDHVALEFMSDLLHDPIHWVACPDGWPEAHAKQQDKWRPSIYMPRWASRITLEVTEVRVQRLQDISEEDAQAEGVETDGVCKSWIRPFSLLWNSINAKRGFGWDKNPWEFAISFVCLGCGH